MSLNNDKFLRHLTDFEWSHNIFLSNVQGITYLLSKTNAPSTVVVMV